MADTLDDRHLDNRIVQRYIRKGIVDEKEYEQLLKKLPDLADKAVSVEAEFEEEPER